MVYSLAYRRPAHVDSSAASLHIDEKEQSVDPSQYSGSTGMCHGIPDALSFERIVNGGTCPPCTLRDFMNYLKYIEHSAENLQFFMWYRDYSKRFNELTETERNLSPEWNLSVMDSEIATTQPHLCQMQVSADTAVALKGTGLDSKAGMVENGKVENGKVENGKVENGKVENDTVENDTVENDTVENDTVENDTVENATAKNDKAENDKVDPFQTPTRASSDDEKSRGPPSMISSVDEKSGGSQWVNASSHRKKAEGAFEEAGLKWQPFTIQPFRDEVNRIITIYIADGSPRQLNLSARERNSLLHALTNTTHPSAFKNVTSTVEWSLHHQAHPNFIRWAICNGNRPRVRFARGLGVGGIIGGILTALLITFSGVGRGWRVLAFILFMIGISTLIAAWKGMCVVLHGMHHRHLRPWELFQDEDDETIELNTSLESFITSSSNSYEDEPWIAKYEKRNVVRKIFDRERWIEEPALRQIQDTIFLQSLLGAFVLSAILTGIFVAVPAGHMY